MILSFYLGMFCTNVPNGFDAARAVERGRGIAEESWLKLEIAMNA